MLTSRGLPAEQVHAHAAPRHVVMELRAERCEGADNPSRIVRVRAARSDGVVAEGQFDVGVRAVCAHLGFRPRGIGGNRPRDLEAEEEVVVLIPGPAGAEQRLKIAEARAYAALKR